VWRPCGSHELLPIFPAGTRRLSPLPQLQLVESICAIDHRRLSCWNARCTLLVLRRISNLVPVRAEVPPIEECGMACEFCSASQADFSTLAKAWAAALCHAAQLRRQGHDVLFRGEGCAYPTTWHGMRRLFDEFQSPHVKMFLIDASERFLEQMSPTLGNAAEMFLQHYGLPTEILDFTSDLEIALFFAAGNSQKEVGHRGAIGVLDVNLASQCGTLFKLAQFALPGGAVLRRPMLQEAWGFRQWQKPHDLKTAYARKTVGMTWFTFEKAAGDHEQFAKLQPILDPRGDACAAIMRCWLRHHASTTWTPSTISSRLVQMIERQLQPSLTESARGESGGNQAATLYPRPQS
jgi:hypothetical protein